MAVSEEKTKKAIDKNNHENTIKNIFTNTKYNYTDLTKPVLEGPQPCL
jgi:hypothetical protein